MKTPKSPEKRKIEIMDAAEEFFTTKGYSETTINDILTKVGIAKGTFYYYFTSKQEVMDAIVDRFINMEVNAAEAVATNDALKASEKIFQIIMAQNQHENRKEKMIEELHEVNNAEMHQKSLVETIMRLTPILTGVIEEGMTEGVFKTAYPKETVEFLLVSVGFIFDEGVFQWDPTEQIRKAKAFVHILEMVLGADEGSFQYLLDKLGET